MRSVALAGFGFWVLPVMYALRNAAAGNVLACLALLAFSVAAGEAGWRAAGAEWRRHFRGGDDDGARDGGGGGGGGEAMTPIGGTMAALTRVPSPRTSPRVAAADDGAGTQLQELQLLAPS